MKILLLENIHPVAVSCLKQQGFQVDLERGGFSEEDLLERLPQYDVLGIRSKTQVTSKVLENSKLLKAIGAFCIGTHQIDTKTANLMGIPVFNAPHSNTRSVAELVIGQMINLSRKLGDRNINTHKGYWHKSATGSHEVRGKVLGIIGYGHIGSQVSVLAESLGMTVVFYDIVKKLPLGNSIQAEVLTDLLKMADFVSLHVPGGIQTAKMIARKELEHMKEGSFLVNTSRGSVVDLDDLVEALQSKHIGGAAIDVYPYEPKGNEEKFQSVLMGMENVILTPHIGGSTEEAQESIGREVSMSFVKFIFNGSTTGAVNFPNVDLPVHVDAHRILNVHKNEPGVLKSINEVVSNLGGNIRGQFLNTDSHIGYLVMDLERSRAQEVADKISNLSSNIRTRTLS